MSYLIDEVYRRLASNDWFVHSFQMWTRQNIDGRMTDLNINSGTGLAKPPKKKRLFWRKQDQYVPVDFVRRDVPKIAQTFGLRYSDLDDNDFRRQHGDVFLVLGEQEEDSGVLTSYGQACRDNGGRPNDHYFFVKGKPDELKAVIQHLRETPHDLSRFSQQVFGWENRRYSPDFPSERTSVYQPDLFEEMKQLFLYTSDRAVEKIL